MQQRRSRSPSHSSLSQALRPEEDWTKISDLAERRRIQNRIAQRNYRRKLKRRLEDLERRAGDSPPSDAGSPPELSPPLQTDRPSLKEEPSNESVSPYNSSRLSTPELASSQTFETTPHIKTEYQKSPSQGQASFEDSTQTLQQTYAPAVPQSGLGSFSSSMLSNALYSQFDEQMNNTYSSSWLLQHGFTHKPTSNATKRKPTPDPIHTIAQPIDNFMPAVPPLSSESHGYFYDSLVPTTIPWTSSMYTGAEWTKFPSITGAYLPSQTQLLTPPTSTNGDIHHYALSEDTSSIDFALDGHHKQRHYSDELHWNDVWKTTFDEETLRRQSYPRY